MGISLVSTRFTLDVFLSLDVDKCAVAGITTAATAPEDDATSVDVVVGLDVDKCAVAEIFTVATAPEDDATSVNVVVGSDLSVVGLSADNIVGDVSSAVDSASVGAVVEHFVGDIATTLGCVELRQKFFLGNIGLLAESGVGSST